MTALVNSSTDYSALQSDLAKVKTDLAALVEHFGKSASNGARDVTAQIDAGARGLARDVAATSDSAVTAISHQIEKQPLVVLMIALGLGFVGGRLLSR